MIWFFPPNELDFRSCHPGFMIYTPSFEFFFKFRPYVIWGAPFGLFELHHAVSIFGVGGYRACVRHVQPTSSDIGQCRFQSVSILDRLEVGRWKFVFPMFGSNWFCTLLGRIVHGSIRDSAFLFPSGSMLLLRVEGRIKLGLCKQPFVRWRM